MRALAICTLLFIALPATANDKDVLRDACGALKPASKKSSCFDALDRLTLTATPAQPAMPALPVDRAPKFSLRGMQCESLEFSELDSMSLDELEGLYCSYDLGAKSSERVHKKMMAENENNPQVRVALLQRHIATLDRCMRGTTKTGDALRRKFPAIKADCSKMPQKKQVDDAAAEAEEKPVAKPWYQ